MEELPDLSKLSHAEKDELIRSQHAQIRALMQVVEQLTAKVAELTAKVAELEGRLAKNSRNSSKPPSSDGLHRPQPKSLRQTGKPSGGQKGHPGRTLKAVEQPDHVELHAPPDRCDACAQALPPASVVEARQVFDLPPIRVEVTEHRVLETVCACGKVHRGVFPAHVRAAVQYGARLKALCVLLVLHHMMPLWRTAQWMGGLLQVPLSDATVKGFTREAATILQPTVAAIGEAILKTPVAHADETGMNVAGKLHWMHTLATGGLTWIGAHLNRGKGAFDSFGLLARYLGVLVHDGWRAYRDLRCLHALCNAHHLRELTYLFEQMGQAWAKQLFDLLVEANRETDATGGVLSAARLAYYRDAYETLLQAGEANNPRASPSGKRGPTAQSKGLNLIDRLRRYADDVWRFAANRDVPFTNNTAEQAVRMPKVKQKVSGCFRTFAGLTDFCIVRSYLATLHKQDANLVEALTRAFQGSVPQPRFA